MSVEQELKLIAERLIILSSTDENAQNLNYNQPDNDDFQDLTLSKIARQLLKLRRDRQRIFSADIFGEPAWDMLLDMFVQHADGKRISVKSLCIGSGVPNTTALRWISVLVAEGFLMREPSYIDRRITYIYLTRKGYESIRECLIGYLSSMKKYGSKGIFFE